MATLYADEHVPFALSGRLTAQADGRADQGIPDPQVLARATPLGRAVVTNNRFDYVPLHQADPAHGGIVTYSKDPDVAALADRIHEAIEADAPLAGKLLRVNKPSIPRPPKPSP